MGLAQIRFCQFQAGRTNKSKAMKAAAEIEAKIEAQVIRVKEARMMGV